MLSILSWNILADLTDIEWRTRQIANVINTVRPDVVCLQEVLPYASFILKNIFKENYESVYDNPSENNSTTREYGEMIFIRKSIEVVNKFFISLNSKQGRTATFVDIVFNSKKIRISTAHLESLPQNENMRLCQLGQIKSYLVKEDNWVWIGDSNLENRTRDLVCDFITWHESRFFTGTRTASYDKIFTNQNVSNIQLVGHHMVENKWLSDHDGILCLI